MKFLTILKSALHIGTVALPAILNAISPGVGTLVGSILASVLQAEAQIGPGNGDKKKDVALHTVQIAAPAIIQLIEKQSGKDLSDEEEFGQGLTLIQEGVVKILNSFRILPKGAAA